MRIALAGISHEALPASPLRTRLTDFRVLRGRDALDAYASDLPNADLVPTLVAASTAPGGPIEQSVYTALRDEILEQLRTKGPFDGVCLSLHGAMWVEGIGSGEADLVRHIRETVGPQTFISASLDLHANISDTFARTVDIWTAYRTAPHRDTVETAQRALQLLISSLEANARPRPVFIRVPLLLQGEKATTDAEPMLTLEALARTTEQTPGILTAEVVVGFAWADTPDASSGITVIASSETSAETARTHAEHMAHEMWSRRTQFQFTREIAASADAALDIALAASESTVWLTDTGDNPTAGTPGDSTHFLHRLLVRQIPDAVFASIPTPRRFKHALPRVVGPKSA
jgi:microcystin degradation protein MlrC